jgi:hypothetical protein
MSERNMCMACNERPAVTSGPVKLCSQCKKLSEGHERGVAFEKKEPLSA